MKAYINRRSISGPWGGGAAFINAYRKLTPKQNVELLDNKSMIIDPDVILLAGLDNLSPSEISVDQAVMHQMWMPNCKLVLRVNENDARKATNTVDDALIRISGLIDGTVFVSHWLQDYFNDKGWKCKNQTVIINGVDEQIFKPNAKLENAKINIVAHHWSDNKLKGADFYEKLDKFVGMNSDKFSFTYIGRHNCDFQNTHVIKPISGKTLGEELGKYDVYVSASRADPGPNHVLEAISCGLPTYVLNSGGGCVEFAGSDHSYSSWEELENLLRSQKFVINTTKLFSWEDCVKSYNLFMEKTCQLEFRNCWANAFIT